MLTGLLSLSETELARKSKRELIAELGRIRQSLENVNGGHHAPTSGTLGDPESSERRLLDAIEAVPSGFALFDPADRLIICNSVYRELLGVSGEESPSGLTYEELLRPVVERGLILEAVGREEAFIRERLEHHRHPTEDIVLHLPGGRWWRVGETRIHDGSTLCICTDVTKLKQTEEELHFAQERLAGILAISNDAIISVDEEQRIVIFNAGAEKTFGYQRQEMIGQPLQTLLPERFRQAHHGHMEAFANGGLVSRAMSERAEVLAIRKDGSEFPAEASISKLELGGTRIFTVILRDISRRWQADDALRASQRLLQTAFDAIPHNISVKNLDGRYLMVNKSVCDFLGYPLQEIIGKTTLEIERAANAEKFDVDRLDRVVLSGQERLTINEYTRTASDGRESILHTIRAALTDALGNVSGVVVVSMDITEQRQAEQRAEQAHTRLMDAMESISQGFVLYDADDRLVLWNQKFARINSDIAELLKSGTPFETLVRAIAKGARVSGRGIDPDQWAERRIARHRNPQGTEERPGADGGWYLASEHKTRGGGMAGVWTDITDLKRVEEALRAREEQLRLFITHAPVAVAMFDRGMRYLVHSRRWVEDFDLGEDDLTGRSHYDVFPELTRKWADAFARCLAGSVERSEEDSFNRADGTLDWVRWEIHPWRDMRGDISGIVMFIEVINERKRAEAQLIRSQRMEAVGQITGGVAHEFNNLLHIIHSYAYLIGEERPQDEQLAALVKPIENATQRGAVLVKQLLSFSRRQLLQPSPIDLNKVTLEMLALIRPPLGEAVELTVSTGKGLWPVLLDQGELEYALLNLALNARDAMPRGGKLTIKTQNWVGAPPDSGQDDPDGWGQFVMLSVTDTGCGMTSEVRDRAFEPFYTTKGMAQHSGLGLSMVHGFVNQSGGFVEIETEVDVGTSVKMFLPSVE
ncbi:MAG: PAS domain S-box protein [SAR324 cluster bacterium]|nr:PAS domain S-box protein [SAR324 cluster bacterium]